MRANNPNDIGRSRARPAPIQAALKSIRARREASALSGIQESRTPDLDEVAQAKLRNYLQAILIALSLLAYRFDPAISVESVVFTSIASFASAIPLYIWALGFQKGWFDTQYRFYQRCVCILSDNVFISLVLYIGGESLAAVWALYIWISVGYGVRYGVTYLRWNVLASVLAFALAAAYTPFWSSRPFFAIGLGLAMAAVPLYVSWLITRLHLAVDQREAAYRAKSDFVARMSHELRTPLHAIISTTELLKQSDSVRTQQDLLNVIAVSSTTLLSLINRVLDLSKFESGSISLTSVPMNIHTLVSDVGTIIWPEAQRKGLALRIYSDPTISSELAGASEQLKEILLNLLGNAAKFTDKGAVSLAVLLDEDQAASVKLRILISDTGPGIPSSVLPTLFDPFVQADSSIKRRHGGSGLGTSFAKELTRLMGGDISVSSEPGIGTTFEIRLELSKLNATSNVIYAYPLSLAIITVAELSPTLVRILESLRVRVVVFSSLQSFVDNTTVQDENGRLHGLLVNADDFGDNLAGILQTLSNSSTGRPIPAAAFGNAAYRTSAISAGYCSYFVDPTPVSLSAVLSTISAQIAQNASDSSNPKAHISARKPLRILAADDDSTNRMLIERILQQAGHTCFVVDNGEDALFELHDRQYDIAILDMHMPKRDGIEVAKIYRFSHFDSKKPIPIILLTADSTLQARSDAESAGIDRFITKPIRPDDLIEAVEQTYNESVPKTSQNTAVETSAVRHHSKVASIRQHKAQRSQAGQEYINEYSVAELLSFMTREEQTSFFEEFCIDADKYVSTLELVRSADDVPRALDDMHALAGAAVTIGADQLARLAKDIESLGLQEVLENKHRLARELRSHCDATLRQIEERYI